ncbi:MAG: holo-ACP synthase [Myxococcales bacterium]|jgi:holo-[acyl-carrier protein] synthase
MDATERSQGATAAVGIGTDIVEIDRLERSLQRERFAEGVFGEREQAYCEARPRPAQHYAARFAAKEAFLKALGLGIFSGVALRDIEVVREGDEAPRLELGPTAARALEAAGCTQALVSLSHAGNLACAFVVVQ